MNCGAGLEQRCPSCGEPVPPDARFCPHCGTPLQAGATPPAPTPAVAEAPPAEERRQVTVLFADLSGYTAMAERMDPESVKALVDRSLRRLGEEVERFGGQVDKYIGDNVMAIFGAPVAHEDDAERAVRAALGMQEAMGEINAELERDSTASPSSCGSASTPARCWPAAWARATRSSATPSTSPHACRRPGSPAASPSASARCRATAAAIDYDDARAAGPQGQGRARPRVRGHRRPRRALAAPADRARDAARRPRRRGRAARVASTAGSSARAARTWSRSSAPPAWASRACCASSKCACGRVTRCPTCARAAACPTGRASCSGRWARSCGPSAAIVDADPSEVAWRKLTDRLEELLVETGERVTKETGLRQAALLARLLGIEAPEALSPSESRRPAAHARGLLLRRALDDRGDRGRAADGPGLRGHPLGRRRHARPHRAPGAVGARPAAAALPGPRRAARAPAELGRRPPRRHVDLPRPAHADETRELIASLLPADAGRRRRSCPRWPSAPAATRSSPRRWCAGWSRRARRTRPRCPTPCRRCWRRGWTRSTASSAGSCSRRRWWGGRSGPTRWPRWPTPRAATSSAP